MTHALDPAVIPTGAVTGAGAVLARRGHGPEAWDDTDPLLTPIDRYLRQQQELTAVERFSQRPDADAVPAQARYYRDLLPASPPGPGQQYGFDVDLDRCSGCKACVTACHRLNGLDDGEAFRTVGMLVGTISGYDEHHRIAAEGDVLDLATLTIEPWQQTVTTACHHCVDPACLNGCPVDAYEKDPVTGIVKHLDDQCIGCGYCTLTCPYEVPKYNAERGIVRKCDLCSDRLAEGEAPACVQACPTHAISVTVVKVAEAIAAAAAEGRALVPAAPVSSLTVPTTRYRSTRALPADALPADHFSVAPGHAHKPLTVMLVLTQMAVGAFVAELLLNRVAAAELSDTVRPVSAAASLGVGLLAIAASILHLGRPQYAWRAVIGLRHSWLSREIVGFGAFAGSAAAYAATLWLHAGDTLVDALGFTVAGTGVASVGCSAMVYVATGKEWWRPRFTFPKFVLSAAITGPALALLIAALTAAVTGKGAMLAGARPLLLVIGGATVIKIGLELALFRHRRDATFTELRRTALLLRGDLRAAMVVRLVAGLLGGVFLPMITWAAWSQPNPPVEAGIVLGMATVAATAVAEFAERWTFFTAVSSARMPGGLR